MPRAKKSVVAEPDAQTNGNGNNGQKSKNIHQMVKDSGGVAKVTLGQVRDELGHSRLGKGVLAQMNSHLRDNGLGFFPGWVLSEDNPEPRQWQEIWLYERDHTAKSAVLDAVSDPDNNDLVAALELFNADAPDYSGMTPEQRLTLIKAISNS